MRFIIYALALISILSVSFALNFVRVLEIDYRAEIRDSGYTLED